MPSYNNVFSVVWSQSNCDLSLSIELFDRFLPRPILCCNEAVLIAGPINSFHSTCGMKPFYTTSLIWTIECYKTNRKNCLHDLLNKTVGWLYGCTETQIYTPIELENVQNSISDTLFYELFNYD